jgi:hypothetical protein
MRLRVWVAVLAAGAAIGPGMEPRRDQAAAGCAECLRLPGAGGPAGDGRWTDSEASPQSD